MTQSTVEARVQALMKLVTEFAFEAGKSAIAIVEDVDSRSPEGIARKQGYNRAMADVESALRAELGKDAERLDFLDGKGGGWMARESGTGRGYRVHQDREGQYTSARAAIDAAIQQTKDTK